MRKFISKKNIFRSLPFSILFFLLPIVTHAFWIPMLGEVDIPGLIIDIISNLVIDINIICMSLVYYVSVVLNTVIKFTISDFYYPGTIISPIWQLMRDFANVFFAFIIIYIAIKTMLGIMDRSTKKTLVFIMLTALVLNFSLTATKLVVDFSNSFTIAAMNQIPNSSWAGSDAIEYGLATSYLKGMGIFKLFEKTKQDALFAFSGEALVAGSGAGIELSPLAVITYRLINIVTLIALSFVFLTISGVFLVRYVMILFLMIVSPFAFLGFVIPEVQAKVTKPWWDKLYAAALIPPIYMLINVFAVALLTFTTNSLNNGSLGVGDSMIMAVLMSTTSLVVIVYSIIFTISMGLPGVAAVANFGLTSMKSVAAYAGSQTVGRAAGRLSERFNDSWIGKSGAGRVFNEVALRRIANIKGGWVNTYEERDKAQAKADAHWQDVKDRRELGRDIRKYQKNASAKPPVDFTATKAEIDAEIASVIAKIDARMAPTFAKLDADMAPLIAIEEKVRTSGPSNDPAIQKQEEDAIRQLGLLKKQKEVHQQAVAAQKENQLAGLKEEKARVEKNENEYTNSKQIRQAELADKISNLSEGELEQHFDEIAKNPELIAYSTVGKLKKIAEKNESSTINAGSIKKIVDQRMDKVNTALEAYKREQSEANKQAIANAAKTYMPEELAEEMSLGDLQAITATMKPENAKKIFDKKAPQAAKVLKDAYKQAIKDSAQKIADWSAEEVAQLDTDLLMDPAVIKHMSAEAVKKVLDKIKGGDAKKAFLKTIQDTGPTHDAYKWLNEEYNKKGPAAGTTTTSTPNNQGQQTQNNQAQQNAGPTTP